MTNELEDFRNRFDDLIDEVERFAIFVRGHEFQESSAERMNAFRKEAGARRRAAIQKKEEDNANGFLAFEFMAEALESEFRFYLALKADSPSEAWDLLIAAQMAAGNAMKAHSLASHLDRYLRKLEAMEQLFFPTPVFFSPGFVVRSSECSICGSEYGECDHVKGRPYMGEMCVRMINDADFKEVSVVESPADKRCRALSFSDGQKMRDVLTYREVPTSDSHVSS